ncbi:MAG: DUF971 domain-containing protein [Rhodomicrobium sp.]|nr:DUF971 domain-containing protein [Rhodomicrobium sp.]
MTPDRLEVLEKGKVLRIVWADGRTDTLDATTLRRASRSASARRAGFDGDDLDCGDVRITGVAPVGAYAVNIEFSDGESRSIYPWDYFAELARHTACMNDREQPVAATA